MRDINQCQICVHYRGLAEGPLEPAGRVNPRTESLQTPAPQLEPRTVLACDAFPDGIPYQIYLGYYDHEVAFPGDNGVRFEKLPTLE